MRAKRSPPTLRNEKTPVPAAARALGQVAAPSAARTAPDDSIGSTGTDDPTADVPSLPRLALLDAAIRQTRDAIVITTADLDPPGPTIVFVNPAFCAMTGYASDALLGRSPRILQGPETDRSVLDALRAALAAAAPWTGETVNYRSDGRSYRVHWQITPVHAAGAGPAFGPASAAPGTGPITHFVAVQHDVTERRALEARVRTTGTLEALGRLAGGVAHDFNNLLTVIAGGTEFALDLLGPDHPARAELADVQTATRRAAALTRQLLAFGRRQAFVPAPLDVNAAVAAVEPMLARIVGPGIAVVVELAASRALARVDAAQLDQVLVNLAANARDAMPGGGLLTIATAAAVAPEDASGGAKDAGSTAADARTSYVRLTVADTGHGMDAATQARLFEPFFTTKPAGRGTGLGLATVYGIVAQSGGHVRVESAPDRGTTVHVYLPSAVGDAAAAAAADSPAAA